MQINTKSLSLFLTLLTITLSLSINLHHDAANTFVLSNLAASNWIYGGTSEKDLKKSVFDLMTQNNNLVKCNLTFPFYNGQKCVNCDTGLYFNLLSKQCEKCGSGKVENHVCLWSWCCGDCGYWWFILNYYVFYVGFNLM